jgi:hypothetical protein
MKKKVDWSLYLVTDRELSRGRPIEEIVLKYVQLQNISILQSV